MNPKYRRFADRIRDLIEEGKSVAKSESNGRSGYIEGMPLNAWLTKVENIFENVFGRNSPHYRRYEAIEKRRIEFSSEVMSVIGVLSGALDDLEQGFLAGQEQIVAGEVFDSVLEQAKHLNEKGHKDPAAVLARVVLEDALRRLSREESFDDSLTASRLNDELRRVGRYAQPQWRLIQAWLDIGNAAAHGKFSEYKQDDVKNLLGGIEQFLATYFYSS